MDGCEGRSREEEAARSSGKWLRSVVVEAKGGFEVEIEANEMKGESKAKCKEARQGRARGSIEEEDL